MKKIITAATTAALLASSSLAAAAVRPSASIPQASAVGGKSLAVAQTRRAGPQLSGESNLLGAAIGLWIILFGAAAIATSWASFDVDDDEVSPN